MTPIFLFYFSCFFWFDSRLRSDVADLYFELYGRKKPIAVPNPELAMLKPQRVEKPKEKKGDGEKAFTIPKAEKRKVEMPAPPPPVAAEFPDSVEFGSKKV